MLILYGTFFENAIVLLVQVSSIHPGLSTNTIPIWVVVPNILNLPTTRIKYSHIESTNLVTLANWCTIVALPMLHQAPLALAHLVASLALVVIKAIYMAKGSATVTWLMTSRLYHHAQPIALPQQIILDATTILAY